jgi:hypothetical protein
MQMVNVLLIKEQQHWIAQCVERDLVAQGRTLDEAMESFVHVLTTQLMLDARAGRDPLSDVPAPPKEVERRFWGAKKLEEGRVIRPNPTDIPPAWMIDAFQNEFRVAQ